MTVSSLFQDVLSPLASLEIFHLLDKSVTSFPDKLFRNRTNLKEIVIKGDQIRFLSSALFANLTSLAVLKLINMNFKQEENSTSGLEPGIFDSLTSLTNFSMVGRGLDLFPENLFAQNKKLERLEFQFFVCSTGPPPCRVVLPKIAQNLTSLEVRTKAKYTH